MERLVYLMRMWGIEFEATWICNEDFAFRGLGLTLSQLRTLRECGFTVLELNEEGNWVSPLVLL